MLRDYLRLSAFLTGLFAALLCMDAHAVAKREVIISPAPTVKEVLPEATRPPHCFVSDAAWYGNVWVPERKLCQCKNQCQRVAWLDGYWACTTFKSNGACADWHWRAGHRISCR
jgi:hypothetical protein